MPRYRVEILPEALDEAHDAFSYSRDGNQQAAEGFQRRLDEAIVELGESAHTWRFYVDDFRMYLLKQYPSAWSTASGKTS